MKIFLKYIIQILILALLINGCEKTTEKQTDDIAKINLTSEYVNLIMSDYYLWNDKLPENPDLSKPPKQLMEDLKYSAFDKWSFIIPTDEYRAIFEEGEYTGYGFSFRDDGEGNVIITYVFKDSPFSEHNINRGWKITSVNNISINSTEGLSTALGTDENANHSFIFEDTDGVSHNYSFSKKNISVNTVLYDTIYQMNDKKIGYFVFESFIEPSEKELDTLFSKFKSANVNELIVDLRYNGGGRSDIGLQLGGLIGGFKVEGQVMSKFIYNEQQSDENQSLLFKNNQNSIDIDRVFFITTKGSASASEMVINGLEPFMDVYLIGDDTHGKPVGMNVWPFKDYTFAPVTFKITNANDYGDYYDGIPADSYVEDDIYHMFGDTSELCLNEALHYIRFNSFSPKSAVKSSRHIVEAPKYGIRQFMDVY